MTVVVGTAGHIDHGKTTLLRVLTGIDADRLPEERARGMTIDVGYAHLDLGDGTELDFVDVPGHDRLVGNMLVGAGEIDAALLVIAADDGPRAQTREHVELLGALGVDLGLVVITKTDAVDPGRVADVVREAGALIAPTTLAGAPILAASATTGDGLEAVVDALRKLRDHAFARFAGAPGPGAGDHATPATRLAIDRVFTIHGRGTVVTGTLRGAPLEPGAILRVVPGAQDRRVRVREVQVHGRTVDRAGPGRVALNLAGAGVAGLGRGAVLTADPAVVASDRLLVALRPVALGGVGGPSGAGAPGAAARIRQRPMGGARAVPADRTPITLHVGTARVSAIVRRSGRDDADLGGDARGGDAPALADDMAGAIDEVLVTTVTARPGIRTAELVRIGEATLRRAVGPIGSAEPGRSGGGAAASTGGLAHRLVASRLDDLVSAGRLLRDVDRVRPPGVDAAGPGPEVAAAMDRLARLLEPVSPPSLAAAARAAGCPPEGVRLLEAAARIVRLDDDLAWAEPTWRRLASLALELAGRGPLTPAVYRDATGTSRKYVMALLEDLDRRAILRRTPAGHLPGPRAAQLARDHVPEPATGAGPTSSTAGGASR